MPDGRYEALAVAPLVSGRLDPPDIALFYATPRRHDLLHQRPAMGRLQALRLGRGRRVGLRRFLRTSPQGPPAQPVDTVLRRAAVRRGARRQDADGLASRGHRKSGRRHGGARQKRAALSVPAIRHPTGCARRNVGQLPRPGNFTLVAAMCLILGLYCLSGGSALHSRSMRNLSIIYPHNRNSEMIRTGIRHVAALPCHFPATPSDFAGRRHYMIEIT